MKVVPYLPPFLRRLIPRWIADVVRTFRMRAETLDRIADIDDCLERLRASEEPRIWIDVGAYRGQSTLPWARKYPHLRVYAFEPDPELAAGLMGLLKNYIVLPMAVFDRDGSSPLYVTRYGGANSLLPFDSDCLRDWIGREGLDVVAQVTVPTIRLDTFMNKQGISYVDLLKVDAQGADYAVAVSAGERLHDIRKIILEVAVTKTQLYSGAKDKKTVVAFMEENGFALIRSTTGNHRQEENLTFVQRAR